MTDDSKTSTRNFIRGGQVLLHNYRMIKQLFDRALVFSAIVLLVTTTGIAYYRFNGMHTFSLKHWCAAKVLVFFNSDATQKMIVPNEHGSGVSTIIVPSAAVLRDTRITNSLKEIGAIVTISMFYGIIISIISLLLVFIYLQKRGALQSATKKLRGYDIVDAKDIRRLIKKTDVSDIAIGDIALPKGFETGHILIHGTTGMGKSVCIKELLDQIRARGDRAIIYDQGCDYIGLFHRSSDIILNPLDERTTAWHLWDECRDAADYDSLAAALIANAEHADLFWANSARIVFASIAKKLKTKPDRSISDLLEIALEHDLAQMERYLQGTQAAALISEKADKTSLSIRATMATYLKSLSYIKDTKAAFSIREWIQDDSNRNWLFISSRADRHETLKPLISMWLDLAANALMSLTPSHSRRIWLIFDELASLHKLPYLPNAFAQSRKFGGCIVAGIQSISQLSKIYGQNAANEISGMCNTRIFFRSTSSEAAMWTSKELGQHEIEEMKEGISYSESAMRSGISIAKQRLQQDLISPAEIMSLAALAAYVRLPGGLPITKVKLNYKNRQEISTPFIARIMEQGYG